MIGFNLLIQYQSNFPSKSPLYFSENSKNLTNIQQKEIKDLIWLFNSNKHGNIFTTHELISRLKEKIHNFIENYENLVKIFKAKKTEKNENKKTKQKSFINQQETFKKIVDIEISQKTEDKIISDDQKKENEFKFNKDLKFMNEINFKNNIKATPIKENPIIMKQSFNIVNRITSSDKKNQLNKNFYSRYKEDFQEEDLLGSFN